MIHEQDTLRLSRTPDARPTFKQFRERCGLSRYAVSQLSGVRVLHMYCLEEKYMCIEFADALKLMDVLSRHIGRHVFLHELREFHVKNSQLEHLAAQNQQKRAR